MRAWVSVLVLAVVPAPALAGGLELMPGGTRSVARGGAVAARPEDGMGLLHNPAGLALLQRSQVMLDIDVPLRSMCVDPYGYYGWGVYSAGVSDFGDQLELDDPDDPTIGATYATTPLPEVCNSAELLPLPQLAWVGKLSEDFALGIGQVAPTVVTGLRYGGLDGTKETEYGTLPTPTRYQLIEQKIEAFAPSIGFGYRVTPQLAVGATLTVAMLRATGRTVQNATSGTQPSQDWLAELRAEDLFLPTITMSVHTRPLRGLDLMAAFRWVDGFDGSGEVEYETNTYQREATSGPVPFSNDPVKLAMIEVGVPWALTVGGRYAGLLAAGEATAAGEPTDPLETELWDVELDATFNFNARSSESSVRAGEDVTIITRTASGGGDSQTVALSDLAQISIDRHMEDSIAIRLGGSYSVLPRRLAVHAGGFFETRGVDPSYASIDTFAQRRVGVGTGFVLRLGDFDLMAAYGHIFQETLDLAPPPHELVEAHDNDDVTTGFDQQVGGSFGPDGVRVGGVELMDPDAPSPGEADAVARLQQTSAAPTHARPERIVNAGRYTAAFNVISIGAIYHF